MIKLLLKSLGIVILLVSFGMTTTYCNGFSGEAHAASEKKAAKYFCPMHPHFTSDKPGDCSICHMRLVPAEEEAPTAAASKEDPNETCLMHNCPMEKNGQKCPMLVISEKGERLECPYCKSHAEGKAMKTEEKLPAGYVTVLISPKKQQLIGIKTGVVEKKRTQKSIRAVGRIAYDPMLYQTQAEYLQSLKSSTEPWAQKMLESTRVKLIGMGFNDAMIDDLKTQEAPDKSLLYAIPDGTAWVYANIYEYELAVVKVGDAVNVAASAGSGAAVQGVIKAIDATVDPETRTVRVRAQIKNEKGVFKPDMYVNVSLSADLGEIVTVPSEAVFFTGTANIVFVDGGNSLFEPREIVLGQRVGEGYEVKSGLKEGERVVTNGNFLVDSESRLKAALSGFSAKGGPVSGDNHAQHKG